MSSLIITMPMDLNTASTALFVNDIEVSKRFYIGILGMSVSLDFGGNVIFKNGFAIWQIQPDHIIPKKLGLENISDSRINRFEMYFETETLEEIFESLKRNNVPFVHEIIEEPWGQKTIRFFDPDNHLIEIGESMSHFVSRHYYGGMTIEQVSRKTSVPVDEVKRMITENKRKHGS